MKHKDTYFLKGGDESNPSVFGIGECALFKGLSAEDDADYEEKLIELCRNIEKGESTDLSAHSSILFGFETAILDFTNGGRRIVFDTEFVAGQMNIPINGLVWMGTKDEMVQRINVKIAAGFRTIKIKVGALDFKSELELIDYVRCAYSPDVLEIRLDANGGFTTDNAMKRLTKLAIFDIHSIEQPIKPGNWNEMAYICEHSPIPIALDEELIGVTHPMTMMELLKTIDPKYIVLKPSLMGGFSGSLEWLKMAAQFNIGGWVTSALESNIGLSAIAQWVSTLPARIPQGLGTGNLYLNNIQSPLVQENDYIRYDNNLNCVIPQSKCIEV